MYLIVGLGNPEEEYNHTRHNMGFHVINQLAKKYEISMNRKKFEGIYGDGKIKDQKVILLKPQTYMNASGKSIIQFMHFYKLQPENVIVIYDDMDVEPGRIKIRKQGGPGSHNGMKSVIHEIQSQEISRIRVGIGRPEEQNQMIEYVIGEITSEEEKNLEEGVEKAKEAIGAILEIGIDKAMNQYN